MLCVHHGPFKTNTDPVSYTHLDVYKRQERNGLSLQDTARTVETQKDITLPRMQTDWTESNSEGGWLTRRGTRDNGGRYRYTSQSCVIARYWRQFHEFDTKDQRLFTKGDACLSVSSRVSIVTWSSPYSRRFFVVRAKFLFRINQKKFELQTMFLHGFTSVSYTHLDVYKRQNIFYWNPLIW